MRTCSRYIILVMMSLTGSLQGISGQSLPPELIHAHRLLAVSDTLRGEVKFDLALESIQEAQTIFEQWKSWEGFVACYDKRARVYGNNDQDENRMETVNEGLKFAHQYLPTWHLLVGQLNMQKAEVFLAFGMLDQVPEYLEKAERVFEVSENTEELLWTLMLQATHRYYVGDYHEMEPLLQRILESTPDSLKGAYEIRSSAYQLLSVLYERLGDIGMAIRVGKQSLALNHKIRDLTEQDWVFKATLNQNLGALYREMNDYENAFLYYRAAEQILDSSDVPVKSQMAVVQNSLGLIWNEKGRPDLALKHFKKSIELAGVVGAENREIRISTYQGLTRLYLSTGSYDTARIYVEKALDLRNESKFNLEESYLLLGDVDRAQYRYQAARSHFQMAMQTAMDVFGPGHPQVAPSHNRLAELALLQGESSLALEHSQAAMACLIPGFDPADVFQNPLQPTTRARNFLLISLSLKRAALLSGTDQRETKVLAAAFETSLLAITLIDSMRNELASISSKQDLMKQVFEEYDRGIDIAYQLFEQTGDLAYLSAAFEISEKSKAVMLLSQFRLEEARQFGGVPDSLLQQEMELRQYLQRFEGSIFTEEQKKIPNPKDLEYWKDKVSELRRAYLTLVDQLKADYPAYHSLMYETRVATVDSVRALLPPGGAWVQYFQGDRYLYVFGITAAGLRLEKIEKDDARILAFVESLGHPERAYDPEAFAQWSAEAHALYARLLAPVLPPGVASMTLVPDGVVAFLPFEVLLSEALPADAPVSYSSLPYLLRDHAISYDYSATLHAKTPDALRKQKGSSFLGFAPTFSPDWAMAGTAEGPESAGLLDLRYNREEIESIRKLAGGSLFLEKRATEENFRIQAPHYQILHLATHAYTDDDNPWLSGLAFAPDPDGKTDAFLHVYEICRMEIPAQLAVLSACNTGRGVLAPGEGVMSLAWAFKYAGCPSIVMSQWQVDDAATQEIMRGFYQYLHDGKTTVEALRLTKLDFLASNARNHPFYWSAFVYLGKEMPIHWEVVWYRKPLFLSLMLLLTLAMITGVILFSRKER